MTLHLAQQNQNKLECLAKIRSNIMYKTTVIILLLLILLNQCGQA